MLIVEGKKVAVRYMIHNDIPEIIKMTADNMSLMRHVTEGEFSRILRRRDIVSLVAVPVDSFGVLGFMIFKLAPCHFEILDIAVAEGSKRKGIGRRLVNKLIEKLNDKRDSISMTVNEDNLELCKFLRRCGFNATTPLLRGHFEDRDGVVFVYSLELADKLARVDQP